MDILSRTKKHHSSLSNLQKQILREITTKGPASNTSLTKVLKKSYPNILDAIKILHEKNYLQIISQKQGRGKPEKFYGLTEDGIVKLIDLGIESYDFWKMLFFVFDDKNHHITQSVNKIFEKYETKMLGINGRFTPFLTKITSDGFLTYEYPRIIRNGQESKILQELIYRGPLSFEQIRNKIVPKNQSSKIAKKIIGQSTQKQSSGLLGSALIDVVNSKKNVFKPTSFAVVLEIAELFDEEQTINKNQINKKFCKLVKNNQECVPLVFKKWDGLLGIFPNEDLIQAFTSWIIRDGGLNDPISIGGYQEIFELQYTMGFSNGLKYAVEGMEGQRAFKDWTSEEKIRRKDFKKKNPEQKSDENIKEILKKLNEISMIYHFDENVHQYGLSHDNVSEQAHGNTLSFRFYTWLINAHKDMKESSKLVDFIKNDPDLDEWYRGWLSAFNGYLERVLDGTRKFEQEFT